jgi:TRAP-type C4-dicarboxylate transport system substrate-binding protein
MAHRRTTARGLIGAIVALGVAGALLAARPASAVDYELRYADLGPPQGPRAESLMWWAKEIETRTGGRVKVKFFWSESLARAGETLRLVGAGVADAGTVLSIYNPVELPIWNLANAPSGDSDPWVGMRTWHEMRQAVPELQRETTEHNVRIVMNFTSGPVDILSKTPILAEGELRGKRIRTAGGWTPLLKTAGAKTVNLTFPETYGGFTRGVLDGAIGYIPFLKSYKLYEVVSHVTEARLGQVLGYGAGINLDDWNAMPEDIRTTITEVSDAFIDRYARAYLDDIDQTRRELTAGIGGRTVQFHPLAPEERARWAAKSTFVNDWVNRMSAAGVDGRRIVETLGKIRAKYDAELAGKGYPWARK